MICLHAEKRTFAHYSYLLILKSINNLHTFISIQLGQGNSDGTGQLH